MGLVMSGLVGRERAIEGNTQQRTSERIKSEQSEDRTVDDKEYPSYCRKEPRLDYDVSIATPSSTPCSSNRLRSFGERTDRAYIVAIAPLSLCCRHQTPYRPLVNQ